MSSCHHVTLASQNVCKHSSQLNNLSILFPYEITIIFLHNMGWPNEHAKFDWTLKRLSPHKTDEIMVWACLMAASAHTFVYNVSCWMKKMMFNNSVSHRKPFILMQCWERWSNMGNWRYFSKWTWFGWKVFHHLAGGPKAHQNSIGVAHYCCKTTSVLECFVTAYPTKHVCFN